MCLIKNRNWQKPLRKGNIRWKVLHLGFDGELRSMMYDHIWKRNVRYVSDAHKPLVELRHIKHDNGFHVFVTKADAEEYASCYGRVRVVSVRVKNHIASGIMNSHKLGPSETWQYCTLIRVHKPKKCA